MTSVNLEALKPSFQSPLSKYFILDLDSIKNLEDLENLLFLYQGKFSQVYLILSANHFLEQGWVDRAKEYGIKKICVRIPLLGREAKSAPHIERNEDYASRSETITLFERVVSACSEQFQLSVELLLSDESLDSLFPVLSYFEKNSLPQVSLNPRQLQNSKSMQLIRNCFEQLRIRQQNKMLIHFSVIQDLQVYWNSQTRNVFSGPFRVDIDVANTCTHNCKFCALYSPEMIESSKAKNNGRLDPNLAKFMSLRINRERCLSMLSSLPRTVRHIQFGGVGDPWTHPNIMEFLRAALERSQFIDVLTNFAYVSYEEIDELHKLSGPTRKLHIYVNLSASSAKTYSQVRPNQSAETFEKVLSSIRYALKLRRESQLNCGIRFVFQMVVCSLNFHEMSEFVSLGHELGADEVYLKPIEIHANQHFELLPPAKEFQQELRRAQSTAQTLGVKIRHDELMQALSEEVDSNAVTTSQVLHGNYYLDTYSKIPCMIGYNYFRVRVDGGVRPCCSAEGLDVGDLNKKTWQELWFSDGYATFRNKMESINKDHFHRTDPEWFFCQQCPHIGLNIAASNNRPVPLN